MYRFEVVTSDRHRFINITRQVQAALADTKIEEGVIVVYIPHTTAGVTINESADPTVELDILKDLTRLVPSTQGYYQHFEGNSAAHTLASLVGSSVMVLVQGGNLVLGRWQGIFLCEFDGPRTRTVIVSNAS